MFSNINTALNQPIEELPIQQAHDEPHEPNISQFTNLVDQNSSWYRYGKAFSIYFPLKQRKIFDILSSMSTLVTALLFFLGVFPINQVLYHYNVFPGVFGFRDLLFLTCFAVLLQSNRRIFFVLFVFASAFSVVNFLAYSELVKRGLYMWPVEEYTIFDYVVLLYCIFVLPGTLFTLSVLWFPVRDYRMLKINSENEATMYYQEWSFRHGIYEKREVLNLADYRDTFEAVAEHEITAEDIYLTFSDKHLSQDIQVHLVELCFSGTLRGSEKVYVYPTQVVNQWFCDFGVMSKGRKDVTKLSRKISLVGFQRIGVVDSM